MPAVGDAHAYALQITGDAMEPVFRAGDVVIISPAAPLRRGDRVVVRTRGDEFMAALLLHRSARRLEMRSLNPTRPSRMLSTSELAWIHRIVWASQ